MWLFVFTRSTGVFLGHDSPVALYLTPLLPLMESLKHFVSVLAGS